MIDWYGNFHLTDTDTDMLIMNDANTDTDIDKKNKLGLSRAKLSTAGVEFCKIILQ